MGCCAIFRRARQFTLRKRFPRLHCCSDDWEAANFHAYYGLRFLGRCARRELLDLAMRRYFCRHLCRSMLKAGFCHICRQAPYTNWWLKHHDAPQSYQQAEFMAAVIDEGMKAVGVPAHMLALARREWFGEA